MALLSTLTDAFTGGINAGWNGAGLSSPNVTIVSNQLQIIPSASYQGINASTTYDLTGDYHLIQVNAVPTGSTTPALFFEVRATPYNNNNLLRWDSGAGGSVFNAVSLIGGTGTVRGTVAFTAGMWLRIRESGGTIFWDSSLDGQTWTNRASLANPYAITAVRPFIFAGPNGGSGAYLLDNYNLPPVPATIVTPSTVPGVAAIATPTVTTVTPAVNVPAVRVAGVAAIPSPTLPNPKVASFTDDFATEDNTKWNGYGGGNPAATGGQFSLAPTTGYPGASSVRNYDLVGSSLLFQVNAMPSIGTPSQGVFFQLDVNATNHVRWNWDDSGSFYAVRQVGGADTSGGGVPFTAGMWLRIREAAGVVYWDYSLDGTAWTNQASWTATFSVASVQLDFYAGYYNGADPAPVGAALIDNLNLPPNPPVTVTTVAAVAAVGSPVVRLSRTAAPATVAGVAAVGAVIARGAANALPATVLSVAGVGTPSVVSGSGASATPTTTAGAAAVGTPSVTTGGGSVIPAATVAGLAAVPAPVVRLSRTAAPATVAALASVGVPSVELGYAVQATTVAGSAAVGTPAVTAVGNASISPASITALAGVGSPAVTAGGGVGVLASSVAALSAVPTPGVTRTALAAAATVAAVASVGSVMVVTAASPLPASVLSVAAIGTPSVLLPDMRPTHERPRFDGVPHKSASSP